MRIGLTYDLRSEYLAMGYGEEETAELDRDETVAAIENTLRTLGHETDRIGHLRALMARLLAGDRWDLVFNIAEGLHGVAREAQVPALLEAFRIPYTFSDGVVLGLTLHKALTKRVVRDAGIPTAPFHVVETVADAAAVPFPAPYFAKPLAEGTGKGVTAASVVAGIGALGPVCEALLRRYRQPVLVEGFLPGREFTVGITGTGPAAEAVGTMEVLLREGAEEGVYSYANKENSEERVSYRLLRAEDDPVAARAEGSALEAWRVLGCRDAGRVDLRCDAAGVPHFLEVNPLAGLHPEHSDLPIVAALAGLSYRTLIRRIVDSAAARCNAETAGRVGP
ncbi:MAG: D-alanine--D-alanine ligase [Lentisphaeria bacterium]|nr:D-alanine--D-alanine ligase [Lentisphaeria bacterium]